MPPWPLAMACTSRASWSFELQRLSYRFSTFSISSRLLGSVETTVTIDQSYERTTPLTPASTVDMTNYVKDTNEWIARCLARVQSLDPIVRGGSSTDCARPRFAGTLARPQAEDVADRFAM